MVANVIKSLGGMLAFIPNVILKPCLPKKPVTQFEGPEDLEPLE